MSSERYSSKFFQDYAGESRRSARAIVPLVIELLHPKTVVDVGCGLGTWLEIFRNHGIDEIYGIDGAYVSGMPLRIPAERLIVHDLATPIKLDRQFDLVVCLEVAEHLPPESADTFVASLTRLGSVVLFSAAVPFQGGQHHLNEQWPEYWAGKFRKWDYQLYDPFRARIWNNPEVAYYYAQNLLLFVRRGETGNYSGLKDAVSALPLNVIHPRKWEQANGKDALSLRRVIKALPTALRNSFRERLKRLTRSK